MLVASSLASPQLRRVRGWLATRLAEQRSGVPLARVLLSFRDDWNRGREWKPDDVVDLLRSQPDAFLAIGWISGYSVGSPLYRGVGRRVDRWQEAIADWNKEHDPDLDPGRLCADWRPDLAWKHVDGSEGEASCGTLLGEFQCAASPCYAHPENPCARWEGDMAADWGPAASRFDPAWLARMPTATWQHLVSRYYEGQDFCTGRGHVWGDATDRGAICRTNTEEQKVVLYGRVDAARRRLESVSGVALDLRIPAVREWNARRLLSALVDLGFGPGEPACVILAYKPGFWSRYDGPNKGNRCPSPEANSWSGFDTPENHASCQGGPLAPTPYGPGEFEHAMNEQMRVLFRLLEAPVPEPLRRRGGGGERWGPITWLTTERPETRGQLWWIWEPDVRAHLRGEMDNRWTGLK